MEQTRGTSRSKIVSTRVADTVERRLLSATRVIAKYPSHAPCVIRPHDDSTPKIDREKYLIPRSWSVAQLQSLVRTRVQMNKTQAIYIFLDGGHLPLSTQTIDALFRERRRKEDQLLYVTYSLESTFGATTPNGLHDRALGCRLPNMSTYMSTVQGEGASS